MGEKQYQELVRAMSLEFLIHVSRELQSVSKKIGVTVTQVQLPPLPSLALDQLLSNHSEYPSITSKVDGVKCESAWEAALQTVKSFIIVR